MPYAFWLLAYDSRVAKHYAWLTPDKPSICLSFLPLQKIFLVEAEFLFAGSKVFFGVR
jgi:hypothetical protein